MDKVCWRKSHLAILNLDEYGSYKHAISVESVQQNGGGKMGDLDGWLDGGKGMGGGEGDVLKENTTQVVPLEEITVLLHSEQLVSPCECVCVCACVCHTASLAWHRHRCYPLSCQNPPIKPN